MTGSAEPSPSPVSHRAVSHRAVSHRAVSHLFVYGTLLPGQVRWRLLQPWVTGAGVSDTIRGDLYDTSLGYPAVIPADDDRYRGGTTIGAVFELATHRRSVALEQLDEVEGAVGGLYERRHVTTTAERSAWVYCYGAGLELTPIASGDWCSHIEQHPPT